MVQRLHHVNTALTNSTTQRWLFFVTYIWVCVSGAMQSKEALTYPRIRALIFQLLK